MSKHHPISEFDLISDYFSGLTPQRSDVMVGIGDDAALLRIPQGMDLAVSVDTLVAGVHFYPDTSPANLGHKALAVNLSDLAAMGAEPAWATLALTLPKVEESWLREFCRGFAALANQYQLQLVGGDTTAGPLSLTLQVHGLLPMGKGLMRGGAQVGDAIYVTGTLGDAAMALETKGEWSVRSDLQPLIARLERPTPRVEVGLALRGIASSAIDISDGLVADLGHILASSGVGAKVELDKLPLSPLVAASHQGGERWEAIIAGGDDYELCFTLPPEHRDQVDVIAQRTGVKITPIGVVEAQQQLHCIKPDGSLWTSERAGYQHFSNRDGET
jgi:thiamine-monophosphate kinase